MVKNPKIPSATLERISLYLRFLEELKARGDTVVSSMRLATLCRTNSAQVRKDLSYFGEFGVRGIGYDIDELIKNIKRILGADREWRLCIVGIGNLGSALIGNENFRKRGYRFISAFDIDPEKHGKELPNGVKIQPLSELKETVKRDEIQIGLITTPPSEAQKVADILIDAGIGMILNFSPIQLRQRAGCIIENVDFTVKLDNLAYHLKELEENR